MPKPPLQPAVKDEIAYFQAIPWCAKHLAAAAAAASSTPSSPSENKNNNNNNNNLIIAPVYSRTPKPNTMDDALLSTTLNTNDTIPAFICFYPTPPVADPRRAYLPALQALITLGPLVAGYSGLAHGGLLATVFDEVLSLLAPGARWGAGWREAAEAEAEAEREGKGEGEGALAGVVTAYLHTRYLRPVAVPGTYLVSVRLARREGRKMFVEGRMEDERGVMVVSAEALFIEAMAGKL